MRRKILLVTVLVLLMVLTLATLTGNGVATATANQTVTPEAVEYVEGFNDDKPVHENARYSGVEWYGIEYTPTVSYNLKKVLLMAGGGTGNFIVQLRIDVGGWPSSSVLRQTSFTLVDTVMWQGAEFSSSYYVTAGTTYWIVFKPVQNSRASLAWGAGTPITYVWDYDADGWDGKLTSLPWMARFYRETTGKVDTVLDFWFTPNPVQTGKLCTLSGTVTEAYTGLPVSYASVTVEYSTDGGATWHYAFTLEAHAKGQFEIDFNAPGAGTYLVRGSYAGDASYNPSSHTETLIISPATAASVEIWTNKASYYSGEILTAYVQLKNSGSAINVKVNVWFGIPGGGTYMYETYYLSLPASYTSPVYIWKSLTIPYSALVGTYSVNAELRNAATNALIDTDTYTFTIL